MAGTYEYSLNAVVGKLHDAAKANADKKANSFIAGLKRMRLEFGDGDVLDNTGIAEDKKGSMYRGPGRYEIRFVRGGHGTMKRFKDYMKEYMKWFAGIDDFDVEDYVDENDDGEERFYTIPYEFVEGKFQANDKTDGEGEDFGQLEPISDDEEGSDGPGEKDGGEKVSREEVVKMIAQKLLDELGDKNLKIDDLLRTNPTAKDFVEMGAGDEKKVETALGSKTKDEAAENVEQLKVKPDKDKIEAAAKREKPTSQAVDSMKVGSALAKKFKDTNVKFSGNGIAESRQALQKVKFVNDASKIQDNIKNVLFKGLLAKVQEQVPADYDGKLQLMRFSFRDSDDPETFKDDPLMEVKTEFKISERARKFLEKLGEWLGKNVWKDNAVKLYSAANRFRVGKTSKTYDVGMVVAVALLDKSAKPEETKPELATVDVPKALDTSSDDDSIEDRDNPGEVSDKDKEKASRLYKIVDQLKGKDKNFEFRVMSGTDFYTEVEDDVNLADKGTAGSLKTINKSKSGVACFSKYPAKNDLRDRVKTFISDTDAFKDIGKSFDDVTAGKHVYWLKPADRSRDVGWYFIPFKDEYAKFEDYGDGIEERLDMKNETSKMVKAVMEKKFSDARESLKKILEAKAAARKASIRAE